MQKEIVTILIFSYALILFVSFFVIFIPVINFGFIYDDFALVPLNFDQALDTLFQSKHFRPIWYFSYPAVNSVFEVSSHTHHFFNLCLHLVNCSFVIALTRNFLSFRVAILLVGVWSLLPWVTFPIAWISQRNDLLMAFFLLLALRQMSGASSISFFYITLAFLSKVTCMFFPLVFCFGWMPSQKRLNFVLGSVLFGLMFAVSYWALRNNTTQEHLADLPALMQIINNVKNFVVGWFLILIPLPFLFNPLNVIGFVVMFFALAHLLMKYAQITGETKKYLIFSFFMSLPLAVNYELRITYVQSLFLLIALFSSLRSGFAENNAGRRKLVAHCSIVGLSFLSFSIPATVATLDKFNTGIYDITSDDIAKPPNGFYPNNFYGWFRDAQIRFLTHS